MSSRSANPGSANLVKAALAELGVTLQSETEYREVALRLCALVETIRHLMAEIPDRSEALVLHDLPRPADWQV